MQLQFEKKPLSCLQTVKRETQSQEQTQEIRISDGMPDIGSVIGAWGQVILRSKEWQSDGMSVNGGTMVWVQYMPEEGGQPQCVESWLPFQMRWNFPATEHDGAIFTQCFLCGVDARSTSARKLILRSNVSVQAWAMQPCEKDLYSAADIPQDIQLRRQRYPVMLPMEAGEKAFSLEESFTLPPSVPKIEKLLAYHLQPQIVEEKLMGDKVVFRGNAVLHVLYCADDGGQYAWDFDLPFTQYGELDREYAEQAQILVLPCVTALELDVEVEKLNLKAGLVCQYRISDEALAEVVTDAYSAARSVTPMEQELLIPSILETKNQTIHAQVTCPVDCMRLTDLQFFPRSVHVRNSGENVTLEIPGQFQILYYDMEGQLHTLTQKWEETLTLPVGEGCTVKAMVHTEGKPQGNLMAGNAQLSAELQLTVQTVNGSGIRVIAGIEAGELQQPDPHRPSLILLRPGKKDLWQLAKENGSTVDAIRSANHLQDEPESTKMLIIPVI